MVDLEAQRIRDEVIRAMAEQGEDIESLGLKVPDEAESVSAPIAMPAWERVAETAADSREGEVAEAQLSDEEVERLFLTAVFDDVRAQSADAKLVQPAQWLKAGLVPAHFSAEDWEMFVYEYLEDRRAERDARVVAASATPVRTATRAVGVPRILRTEEEPESEGAATAKGAEEPRQPERSSEASEELRHPERSAEGAESKDPMRRQRKAPRLAPHGILRVPAARGLPALASRARELDSPLDCQMLRSLRMTKGALVQPSQRR